MESEEDKYKHLQRIEHQLRQKETEQRLQELEAEIHAKDINVYKPIKDKPEASGKLRQTQVILGLKLFAFAIVTIAAVKIASVLAGVIIVGTIGFVAYKLFFTEKK
ncbi:hypothetical protein ACF3DV_17905 [Chlorogloeopsis fritschii PCC 9212]|uniref:DUF3040 domain-containing protein n=1 Tax=Chlorogloeopsis fritschii PCC 6912 TaxID=211165 RepID=A0A433N003_CHLFR|nr:MULTISPECIES: hypothetical protein [Chlorogloeopsis]MBF2005821.1 hypothetical protein [Chlorogloeopsis fritschii C42_A2020_084]MDM9379329.1 hypothetical protein [Chlorogloeopsis sp. ULAP01]RUR74182.1 hypothetical protein PCC6912_52830 [Chlorogloeopsis fritschii PCC 6912]